MRTDTEDIVLPSKIAAGGVVSVKNKTLLIKKYGSWDFPKGKIEKGESVEACALRETSEATGLNIDYLKVTESLGKIEYIRKYDGVDYKKIVYWFKMDYALGTEVDLVPDEGEGIECCKWIKTSSISQLKTRKYLKKFVELNFHHNT